MVAFHNPKGQMSTPHDAYELSFDLMAAKDQPRTLGLLANGFPDSENFLRHLGSVLEERLPNLQLRFWNKGNASIPAPAAMLDEIARDCDALVAAYGH
mgnify:CR=1 FL=1